MRRDNTDYSNDSDGEESVPAPTTKIRLYLHCTNLARSIIGPQPHSQCRVSLDPNSPSKDETEIVYKSSSPTYITPFQFDYEYGSQLLIYVDVYACRGKVTKNSSLELKLIGRECFDVQNILSTPTNTKAKPLPNLGGTIYAHIEQQFPTNHECLSLQLRAKSLVFTNSAMRKSLAAKTTLVLGKPSTRFELSRPASSDLSRWIAVYRSAPIKESVTPTWDETLIDLNSICSDGAPSTSANVRISISMEKKKKWKEIGSFETTIQCLIDSCRTDEADRSSFELQPKAVRGRQSNEKKGEIMVVSAVMQRPDEARQRSQRILRGLSSGDIQEKSSNTSKLFSEYVDAGLDIDLFVAIDFTSSNGDARIPGTLHYYKDGMSNDYMDAIESIGNEVEKYSKSKEFPVWGFGAKFPSDEISDVEQLPVQHIFQCGHALPSVVGTQGVLDAYRSVLRSMEFYMSGPTEMQPVMKAALSRAMKVHNDPTKQLKYNVLLILTDGVVNDLDATKRLILKYRHLPISFVIVGIGRADFTEMNRWNDQQSDLRGRFTFVEFRTLQFDPAALSGKALKRLPEDVVDYFSAK